MGSRAHGTRIDEQVFRAGLRRVFWILLSGVSFVLFSLSLNAQVSADWHRRLETITDHLSHNRVTEAEIEVNQMLQVYPKSASAYNLLGICQMRRDRSDEAITSFGKALKLDDSLTQAHFNLGVLSLRSGKFATAVQHLQRVVQAEPSHPENYIALADALLKSGDKPAGTIVAKRMEALKGLDPATHFRMAAMLHENALNEMALEHAKTAVRATPDRVEPALLLASILFTLDQCSEAIRVVEPLVAGRASEASLNSLLGRCYGKIGLHQKAIQVMEDSIRKQPNHVQMYVDLANEYQQAGSLQEARYLLKQARKRFRERGDLRQKLSQLELSLVAQALKDGKTDIAREALEEMEPAERTLEEYQLLSANLLQVKDRNVEALALLQKFAPAFQDSPRFVFTMGLSRYNLGQYREALDLFQKALTLNANFHQAMHYSGQCHANLENYSAAARCQQEAIKMNPKDHTYHFYLGWVLLRLGLSREAEEQFQEAIRLAPSYAPAHYELGKLLLDQDQLTQAIARLSRAIEADPLFDQTYYQLSRAYRKAGDSSQAITYMNKFQEAKRQERERALKRKQATAILP